MLWFTFGESHEDKLISKAVSGDGAAFSELMTMHEKRMYAVALRMCGNREDAQDCLQDAMIRIYRSISGFKGQSSFGTWVYRITMNTCLDELRKRKSRQSASLDNLVESGFSPTDGVNTPEKQAVNSEQRRVLNTAIQSLPEEMRSAIVLRDIQGFTYDEIAEMQDANIGTIKSRISRAREKLRQILRENAELFQ